MKPSVIFLLSLLLSLPVFSQSSGSKPIVFIVDASGSMWQKIKNDYKITLARDVLGNLIRGIPENQPLGLVAYGHRQKDDCADIEELLPLSNQNKAAFQQKLEELNPTGKTPLAQSAIQVIGQLKNTKEAATIILVTDGIETCEGDICTIVEEAKAEGVDFVMHIVGFGLGSEDRTTLECAARAGDGLYLDASDKEQLVEALQQTSELTVDIPKGKLAVTCKRNGNLVDGLITVYKTGTDEDIAKLRSYSHASTNPAVFNIPAGEYDVVVNLVGQSGVIPMKKSDIVVTETEINEQLFDFSSGYVEVKVQKNGALHDAAVKIRPHGENKQIAGGRTYSAATSNPLKKELTPGLYDLMITSVTIKGLSAEALLEQVEVKSGETTQVAHEFESATLLIGTTYKGILCDAAVSIRSVNPKQSIAGGRTYTAATSNPKSFLLSPGEYEIEVQGVRVNGNPKEKFTVTLNPGDTIERSIKW